MLPGANSVPWMEGEVEDAASWTRATNNEAEQKDDEIAIAGPVTSFKSILEGDWFMNSGMNPTEFIESCLFIVGPFSIVEHKSRPG